MARKLTEQQVEDRIAMYDEVIEHLQMSVCESKGEEEQAKIIIKQIRLLRDRFINSQQKEK